MHENNPDTPPQQPVPESLDVNTLFSASAFPAAAQRCAPAARPGSAARAPGSLRARPGVGGMLSGSVGVLGSGAAACSGQQLGRRARRRALGQRTRRGAALGGCLHSRSACTPASSWVKHLHDAGCRAGKVKACGSLRAAAARPAAATRLRVCWPPSRRDLMQGLGESRAPRDAGRARGACAACAGWRPWRAPRCGATGGGARRAAPRCPRTARPPAAAPPGPCAPPWPARSAAAGPWRGCARPSRVHIPVTIATLACL